VYDILKQLGINPINILNPFKQYQSQVLLKSELSVEYHLDKLRQQFDSQNGISRIVVGEIIKGIEINIPK
jgi:hypothetical protein